MTDANGDRGAELGRQWLLELVHNRRLSPTQRRVVQSMLDSLPGVAFASTVEMAEIAGVSQPTVARIATALGFSGYPEFRAAIRDVVLAAPPTSDETARPSAVQLALSAEVSNLQSLEATLDGGALTKAVETLFRSRPLAVAGLRASSATAHYFGYFAQRVLPDVRILDEASSLEDNILQLHDDGGSAFFAIAMPRYPLALVRGVTLAKQLGMATVVMVDTPLVPFRDLIDVALIAPVSSDLVFDSHASATVLSIALLDGLAGKDPRRTQRRLEAHERLVDSWALKER